MIGEKLGKYTLLETVGTGSMGTVYKAEDPDGRVVALKLVRSQVLYDIERRERFLQELLSASMVHHEGLCPVLEIGDDNDDFFVVMPFLNGVTLESFLEHKPLPWQNALAVAISAAKPLVSAHAAGVVHRSLKPANIRLLEDGSVVVTDCAIARFTEISRRRRVRPGDPPVDFADMLIPLPALSYMSPEQVRGDAVDARADVFSLGVTLYEMVTGRHPFEARNSLSRMSAILEARPAPPNSKLGEIPAELDRILRKSLAKEPADRFGSMEEFLADMEALLKDQAVEAPLLSVSRKSRHVPRILWLAAIIALAAVIAGIVYFLMR